MTDHPSVPADVSTANEPIELIRISAGLPGARRSWAELISSLHGGLALLDTGERIEQVSAGFLAITGLVASDVVGRDTRDLFPAFGQSGTRSIIDRVQRGELVGVDQRLTDADGLQRWIRVSALSTAGLGDEPRVVVFVQGTSSTSHAMALRRQATMRLTEVEEHELERLRRHIHDGPLQMLTALNWRLSTSGGLASTTRIHGRIDDITAELRRVLVELAPERERTVGAILERWIAPFLVGAPIELRIDDHLDEPPNRSLTQAAFIFLYEMVRATRPTPIDRIQTLSLDHERDGYRFLLTTTAAGPGQIMNQPAQVSFQAMLEYVRALGGTLETELTDDAIRTFSIWLPATAETMFDDESSPIVDRPLERHPAEWIRADGTDSPPELSEQSWEQLLRDAPEPIVEFDTRLNWLFANHAYEALHAASEDELRDGSPATERFTPDELAQIGEQMLRVLEGEPVIFEWTRQSADGQVRFVRATGTPRVDAAGTVSSALSAVEDHSDLHFLTHLQRSALEDLGRSRLRARRQSFDQLRQPLVELERLSAELEGVEHVASDPESIASIRIGLLGAMRSITRSVELLDAPEHGDSAVGSTIGWSLQALFPSVEIDVAGDVDVLLTVEQADVLFHIAREATVNAVLHGRARRIEVVMAAGPDRLEMSVRDDGVGVDPADLDTSDEQLGVRLMVERARASSGRCTIEPGPEGGTVVTVTLPRENADRAAPR